MRVRRASGLLVACFAIGCSTATSPEVSRYLLRTPETREVRLNPVGPGLVLTRVDCASHLNGLVVLRPDGVADTLVYHRLAAPIPEMASHALKEKLIGSGAFSFVEDAGAATDAKTLGLRLRIERLEIEEHPDGSATAVALLDAFLTLGPDEKRVSGFVGRARREVPVAAPTTPAILVEGLRVVLDGATTDLVAAVVSRIQKGV